jgi:hypothetical protein
VFAYLVVPFAFGIGTWALVRVKLRHPLGLPMLLQLLLLTVLGIDELGLDANGSRTTMPLLVLGTVALEGYLKMPRLLGWRMHGSAPSGPPGETHPDLPR